MREICIVGTDARADYAVQALQEAGYAATRTTLSEAQEHAARGSVIVGGGLSNTLGGLDYLKDEAFLYDNARITAEGAVMLLGASTRGTVFDMDVAVIGMGRIAECLCPLLCALGAQVTVYARRPEVLARARAMGAKTVRVSGALPARAAQHDAVCNTVPHVLYDRELLLDARSDTVLMELASVPGGFDLDAVTEFGLHYVNGQGLPGKYAPRAAGKLIADYVIDTLKGEKA